MTPNLFGNLDIHEPIQDNNYIADANALQNYDITQMVDIEWKIMIQGNK